MNAIAPFTECAYGKPTLSSDRDVEYNVFSSVTRSLRKAKNSDDFQEIILAVTRNSDLWTILADDLSSAGNQLPDKVKMGLISLASFSVKTGQAVLGRRSSVDVLIDVNMSIMKGLRGDFSNGRDAA